MVGVHYLYSIHLLFLAHALSDDAPMDDGSTIKAAPERIVRAFSPNPIGERKLIQKIYPEIRNRRHPQKMSSNENHDNRGYEQERTSDDCILYLHVALSVSG